MPKKTSKEDFERIFNELFGTHIRWSKLSRDELVELATVLNHPEIILNRLGIKKEELRTRILGERLIDLGKDFAKTWLEIWDGPFAQFAREVLGRKKKEAVKPKEEAKEEVSVNL